MTASAQAGPADPAKDSMLVRARGLRYSYGANVVLDGLDLDVPRGKVTGIIGPTASGKTTLLRILGGQFRPAAGTVHFDGHDVHRLGRHELFELRKRMGMMFQSQALLTDMNVFDNVAYPLREHTELPEALIRDVVIMKLQAVGLRGARNLRPDELSGGMARRVALARAIVFDPDLVMYDEPFAGQDPITLGVLMRLIRNLTDGLNTTSVVVSYSVKELMQVSDYVFVIDGGRVIEHGTPEAIRASSSPHVRQVVAGAEGGPATFHFKAPPAPQDFLRPTR